jgi:hypothetical protein
METVVFLGAFDLSFNYISHNNVALECVDESAYVDQSAYVVQSVLPELCEADNAIRFDVPIESDRIHSVTFCYKKTSNN